MQQVVWNLLSNAVKFTPSGGRVTVELVRTGDWVTIQVTDTGSGIRPELLPHIFDRFLQGESGAARQHSGLGLGLAISKQLVELHQGTISASSEGEGKGAVFMVRLPFKAETPDAEVSLPLGDRRAPELDGLRILLVEDEPSAREGTRALLQAARANVQPVESAMAAREAYLVQRPDIIISDVGLPGEDGYALLQQIRSIEREKGGPRVPALALTAFARPEDRQRAIAAGFDVHIAKPVDPERLMEQITRLARRRPG
jgi:CheY-like chemotaxis protein/anti-sigma regulatory factor (Ser/Thr protein kinase)